MAGWVGRAERWAEFEPKWKSLLRRNGLTQIHAVDLKQGKKQFKDKIRWPEHRRLALAHEAGQLALNHSMFNHTVLLKNSDYDIHYIGGDRKLRKHRAPIDSKYGVCVRVFLSQLTEFVRRYGGGDAQVTVVLEAGAKNQGAAQSILADMYRIAPDRARFISPNIVYALKEQSPGVQAADLLAYPVYVLERDGSVEVLDLDEGFPDSLPSQGVESFRSPIRPKTLIDLKAGQQALRPLRRRLGRDWGHLDGFPVGWTTRSLRSVERFLLVPPNPEPVLSIDAANPENPEPMHSVRLRCL
jgi:hypothetical protein